MSQQTIIVGQALIGRAPEDGFRIEVPAKHLHSEYECDRLIQWLRTAVLTRFGPSGSKITLEIS